MSIEIKELKETINDLKGVIMGVISDMGVKQNYTTDTEIDIDNNIYNNDHIPVDDILSDDINKKEKNNKKENTIDNPISNDCRNDYNEDTNKSGDISIQEEIELDELVNSIPTIKELMNNKQQDNITNIPMIEEHNNNSETDKTIVNPMSVVLTFPVNISGKKQEINLNVEVNDINSLTHTETRDIYTNLKHQIFLLTPETMIDGYWTKDCYNSYPSPYEFEHSLLPDAVRKCKFNDDIKECSAPAPAVNAQECPTIADQSSNDKEYQKAQENATGAKTKAKNEDVVNLLSDIKRIIREKNGNEDDLNKVFNPFYSCLLNGNLTNEEIEYGIYQFYCIIKMALDERYYEDYESFLTETNYNVITGILNKRLKGIEFSVFDRDRYEVKKCA